MRFSIFSTNWKFSWLKKIQNIKLFIDSSFVIVVVKGIWTILAIHHLPRLRWKLLKQFIVEFESFNFPVRSPNIFLSGTHLPATIHKFSRLQRRREDAFCNWLKSLVLNFPQQENVKILPTYQSKLPLNTFRLSAILMEQIFYWDRHRNSGTIKI